MTNQEIINGLAKFFTNGDTLAECPIVITSREDIKGEQAELIRFTFGEYEDSCVAIVYADGTIYTPTDWQAPSWYDEDWYIDDSDWMDCYFNRCVNIDGMPRIL